MDPAVIIVNPAAGRGRVEGQLARIQAWVRRWAPEAPVWVTEGPGHASELTRRAPPDARVVAVGGDGTAHEVVRALSPGQVLGLVPVGSGNDIARMAGLRRVGIERALATALWGGVVRYDRGVVNGEPFASSATAGLDAAVARRAFAAPRYLRGLPRYLWALAAELRGLALPEVRVEVDREEVYAGPMLLAAAMNSATYGGGFPIAPMARPDDGRLELVWAGAFTRLGVLGILPRLLAGRHLGHPRIGHRSGVRFRLRFDRPVPIQADGEVLPERSDFEVALEPAALPIAADPGAREGTPAREEARPVTAMPEPTV